MSSGARNWPFLMLTTRPVLRRGDEQDRSGGEERRNLQHVGDRRPPVPRLRRLVNVGRGSARRACALIAASARSPSSSPGPRNERLDVRFALS